MDKWEKERLEQIRFNITEKNIHKYIDLLSEYNIKTGDFSFKFYF